MTLLSLSIDPLIILWTAVIVVTLVIEFTTADLTTIWFCCGAILSLITAIFEAPLWVQIVVFLVSSLLCVILTRPLVKKMQTKGNVRTNADKVLGETVVVTKRVSKDEIGEVKAETVLWRAITKDDEVFIEGDKAKVLEIIGTKLLITKEDIND